MNAIVSAISKAGEAKITFAETQSMLAARLDTTMSWESPNMSLIAEFARTVSGGAVSGFCVSSLTRVRDVDSESYVWTADAVSRINVYVARPGSAKTRVLVAAVRVSASQYAVGGGSVSAEQIASQLRRDLSTRIAASGDYVLVDRNSTSEIDKEMAMITSGRVNREAIARIGKMVAADVVVIPAIINLDYGLRTRALRTSDRTLRWYDGGMELSFMVMDLVTGEVRSSKEVSKQFPGTEPTTMAIGVDARSVVNQAVAEAAAEFAQDMLIGTTELYVVDLDAPRVIINGGRELLSVGDRLIAHGVGEELFHPVSKESLGREEIVVGEVVIDRVSDQVSYGTITVDSDLEGALDTFEMIKLEVSRE